MKEIETLLALYGGIPPVRYEIIDSSHGEEDFRETILAEWNDRKLAIKAACNDFTTPRRVEGWAATVQAFRSLRYYCPAFVPDRRGHLAQTLPYRGHACVVYAEEFAAYRTAEQLGAATLGCAEAVLPEMIRLLGAVGSAHLTTADFPSGLRILEKFCPSDPCDEVMETSQEFRDTLLARFPPLRARFDAIWARYLENAAELEAIYPSLPVSVFQADIGASNVLLDEAGRFAGVLDFNLCGRDSVLNNLFRTAFTAFSTVPCREKQNIFLDAALDRRALDDFCRIVRLSAASYAYSDAEKAAAPLLYRYLRPFWWHPAAVIARSSTDLALAAHILDWAEREQTREIDFPALMEGL